MTPTFKVLVPVDGSQCSLRAIKHLIELWDYLGQMEVRIVNVRPPMPKTKSGRHVDEQGYQRDQAEGMAIVRQAGALLEKAGRRYTPQVFDGDPAETIARQAKRAQSDMIIMGARGLGRVRSLLLGSVTTRVLQLTRIPVTLVK